MRAPDWLREFFRWRWAPCVTLIAGSLAFIALVLLLVPEPPAMTAHTVATLPAFSVGLPRAAFNAAVADEVVAPAAPVRTAEPVASPMPATVPTPSEPSQRVDLVQPDFAANIADRGDRPQAPLRR